MSDKQRENKVRMKKSGGWYCSTEQEMHWHLLLISEAGGVPLLGGASAKVCKQLHSQQ